MASCRNRGLPLLCRALGGHSTIGEHSMKIVWLAVAADTFARRHSNVEHKGCSMGSNKMCQEREQVQQGQQKWVGPTSGGARPPEVASPRTAVLPLEEEAQPWFVPAAGLGTACFFWGWIKQCATTGRLRYQEQKKTEGLQSWLPRFWAALARVKRRC